MVRVKTMGGLVAMLAVACAEPERGESEGRPPWFEPPVIEPHEGPGELTVSGLATGSEVAFQDGAGEVVSWQTAGEDGTAQGGIPEGGMVSVAHAIGDERVVEIAAGLATGMAIRFGHDSEDAGTAIGTLQVVTPGGWMGAGYYSFTCGCWSAGSVLPPGTVTLEVRGPDCDPSDLAVLGLAHDAAGAPLAYSFAVGIALPQGGVAEVTLGEWKADFELVTVGATNAPDGAIVHVMSWMRRGPGEFGAVAWSGGSQGTSVSPTVTLLRPPGFADGFGYRVGYGLGYTGNDGGSVLDVRDAGTASSILVNLEQDLLTLPSAGALDLSDPARPQISLGGGLSGADAVELAMDWEDPAGGWLSSRILAPALPGTVVRHPALPAEWGSLRPTSELVFRDAWLTSVDSSAAAGYPILAASFYAAPAAGAVERRAWTRVDGGGE